MTSLGVMSPLAMLVIAGACWSEVPVSGIWCEVFGFSLCSARLLCKDPAV